MATSITKDNARIVSVDGSDKSRDSAFFSSASSSSSISNSHITTPKKKKLQSFKKFFVKSNPHAESPSSSISPPTKKKAFKEIFVSKGKSSHKPFKGLKQQKQKTDKRATKKDGLEMLQKYGVCEKGVIGKGATAVVRIAHKSDKSGCEKLYAVKEFRHKRKNETEKEYIKKLASEFCISSSLRNANIVETVDLIKNEGGHWVQVMEYMPTDLYHIIKSGRMGGAEIDCCFKQLVRGVAYMHSAGVAHRDLKPENLLMNEHGQLKITDFGASDVFHVMWEKKAHLSKGLCGSEPYIAPEVYKCREYNAQLVDIWSIGIVHYCMLFQGIPFQAAVSTDPSYTQYLKAHAARNYTPFEKMSKPCRDLMYRIIDPNPKTRITMTEILENEWFKSIEVCSDCQTSNGEHHHILESSHHHCLKSKF